MQKSMLIRDTTREEREAIIRDSLGITDGMCDGCASGLIDMYDDYINGKTEIAEINAGFKAHYVSGDQGEENSRSCFGSAES